MTRRLYDALSVVRFLINHNIVSFPHIIPDQSANTLFPLNVFFEVMNEIEESSEELSVDEVEEVLVKRLQEKQHDSQKEYKEKENIYSDSSYRFVKFISRRLVSAEIIEGERKKELNFFYPYEVQIMDYDTYLNNISGPAAHDKYKERQRQAARRRLFGLSLQPND